MELMRQTMITISDFADRLAKLRLQKGISSREMSLSIGQNESFINTKRIVTVVTVHTSLSLEVFWEKLMKNLSIFCIIYA